MIAFVKGTVADVTLSSVVLEVGGVGLELHCTPHTLATLRLGAAATLPTSMVVREESLTLFGFLDDDEKSVFELVQTASGVGPKLAQAMLAVLAPDALRRAVAGEDVKALTAVPGIGQKGAQRIILELKDRIGVPRGTGAARLAARGRARGGLARPGPRRPGRARLVGQGGRPCGRGGGARRRVTTPDVAALLRGGPALAEQGMSAADRAGRPARPTSRPPSWPTPRAARSWRAEAEGDERAVEAALRPRTLDEVDRAGAGPRAALAGAPGRPGPRARSRPRAALRAARAGQDHAGDDHRRGDVQPAAAHLRAGDHPRRRPGGDPVRASTRATCSSSTRSTGWRGRPRRCSTWRWRTSGSTSSSARGPGATAIPLEIPPFTLVGATTRAGLLPGPLRDRFGFTAHLEFYDPAELDLIVRRSAGLLGVELTDEGAAEIASPVAGHAPDRQPAAAPGARLRPGAGRRGGDPRRRAPGARPLRGGPVGSGPARPGRPRRPLPALRRRPGGRLHAGRRPWGRSARPSRRSRSRSWSAPACSPAPRADGWPPRPPGRTSGWSRRRGRPSSPPRWPIPRSRRGSSTPRAERTGTEP